MNVEKIRDRFPEKLDNVVLTLGNFDGVHRGHQKLLRLTRDKARQRLGRAVVMTFDPHPVQVFKPSLFKQIQSLDDRLCRIEQSGVDTCVVVEFTRNLADHTPREFVLEWMLRLFDLKEVVIGYDTTFGKGRTGSPPMMEEFGRAFGFDTHVVEAIYIGDEPVSSSRIRRTVAAGKVEEATDLLGYNYFLRGTVVKGFGRGAAVLGYPTANIKTETNLIPANGVYAAWFHRNGDRYRGALNVGTNPTFGNQAVSVETYILDFDEDIYGEDVKVEFVQRLRGERKFDSIDALKQQMTLDVAEVRRVLR